ncbi:1-acyl-sn-glycerol-3-phosphate acyltransferase [Streptomyces broussonetiae]|uniref:1-acyl-sn-glycerol-3-phosphate acyltransferase n=1 Tax=Streptomyces broussonetiae TaxID=2686304 RepID=UPI001E2F57E3|nr:1-acyl-sn-glycerol-3-phosphate acyltransferase [Streptomyces broussonetiae]
MSRRRAVRVAGAVVTGLRRTTTTALLLALVPTVAALLIAAGVLCAPVSLATQGSWRPVRITGFAFIYLLVDLAGLVAAAVLWARRLPDRLDREERISADAFAVLERLLRQLRRAGEQVFRLQVEVRPPPPGETGHAAVPVLVFVRHAGVGDSFLLLQILLSQAGLRPHTVLKRTLRADPALDVLIGRVPHCFLPPFDGRAEDAIADLAAGLGPGDALVIFPEGGNFTPRRRRRAIASLRRQGLPRRASRAERMRHVLPPRDAGALAAIAAAPTADVVFVAHTGLDVVHSARSVWSQLPLREGVRARWWRIPASRVPPGNDARSEWLLTQWARVDRWITDHATPDATHA